MRIKDEFLLIEELRHRFMGKFNTQADKKKQSG